MAGGLSIIGLALLAVLAPLGWAACALLRDGHDEMEELFLIGFGDADRAHVRAAEDLQ